MNNLLSQINQYKKLGILWLVILGVFIYGFSIYIPLKKKNISLASRDASACLIDESSQNVQSEKTVQENTNIHLFVSCGGFLE